MTDRLRLFWKISLQIAAEPYKRMKSMALSIRFRCQKAYKFT